MEWIFFWLAITVVALIVEFSTANIVSIWFAGGGLISLILSAFNLAWYIHIPAFIIVSAVLLLCFRKLVIKKFNKIQVSTNAEQCVGQQFRLLSEIGFNKAGSIKINDVVWSVETEEQMGVIPEGSLVKIVGIRGNKYIVEEVKE